jgi:hypothetical protein
MSFDLLAFKAACGRFALIYLHELLELVAQREEQIVVAAKNAFEVHGNGCPCEFLEDSLRNLLVIKPIRPS